MTEREHAIVHLLNEMQALLNKACDLIDAQVKEEIPDDKSEPR